MEYRVIKLHATLFQNSSKFTGNISNISTSTSHTYLHVNLDDSTLAPPGFSSGEDLDASSSFVLTERDQDREGSYPTVLPIFTDFYRFLPDFRTFFLLPTFFLSECSIHQGSLPSVLFASESFTVDY